jgi:hypothetical protein
MTWTGTLCTSKAIINKAGASANATVTASEALLQEFYDEAEGRILSDTKIDWTSGYSTLASGAKQCLADAVSDLAAIKVIQYDLSSFSRLLEAQSMVDMLLDNAKTEISLLRDFKNNSIKVL